MRYRVPLIPAALAAGLVYTLGFAQNRPAAAAADEEQAIRKATQAYVDAFNKADLDGVMAIWSSDPEYMDEDGTCTKGREAVAAIFKKSMQENKGLKIAIKTSALRFLKDDVALQDGSSTVTKSTGESESNPFSAVWIKKEGKWLVNHVRDLSAPGATAAAEHPGTRLKELDWLVGEWKHDGKEHKTTLTARWAKGQKFLIVEVVVHGKSEDILSIHQIVGWDPTTDRVHSWLFDSRGGFGEGFWNKKGETWNVNTVGITMDGRHGTGVNKWALVDENTFTFQALDRTLDGQPMPDVKIAYTRSAKAK